jgi:glutamate---cysteine ligase / carboxylate-amine ligase
MTSKKPWKLFERFGIEIEYAICHKESLEVLPIADLLMHDIAGSFCNEVNAGAISYSNELALHVFEFKCSEPIEQLEGLGDVFQEHVQKVNAHLEKADAWLMPGGMHPWMDPHKQMRLWTHEQNEIYEAYNRIFNCKGHGWANLQSTHINLPFSSDEELCALHSAVRWVLPIMPALSASSPIVDGKISGYLDTRLETYRHNQKIIPSIAGLVIPDAIASKEEYFDKILRPMWREIAPYDPDTILQEDWLNSRGAIVKFDRSAVEIRILDNQECPSMDIAIAQAIVFVVQQLSEKVLAGEIVYDKIDTKYLADLFLHVVKEGEESLISDKEYLSIFGCWHPTKVKNLWKKLLASYWKICSPKTAHLQQQLLKRGPLARALLRDWESTPSLDRAKIYKKLCHCLETGTFYA